MLKNLTITAALIFASGSTVAIAAPAETRSFVHDGDTYNYRVEEKGRLRIIRGTVEKTGLPFVLYVSKKKVTGTVDGHYVSFARSEVKNLGSDVQMASR